MRESEIIDKTIDDLTRQGLFNAEKFCIQHGSTTVYDHSEHVAGTSLYLAEFFHLKVDTNSLIRGALLHDYFLYDWHQKERWHRMHGFRHPQMALKNAERDFDLTEIEKNIIVRHMFPLTPCPPKYKEAWIVCIADKICTCREIIKNK